MLLTTLLFLLQLRFDRYWVHAGYFGVSIIHRNVIWTFNTLTCVCDVNNSASSSSPLMFCVPQGSVLGPVLFILYTTPLSDIIANHSVNRHLFADDTQLQKSTPPNDVQSLTHDLQSCTDNIKARMCNDQLKLNEDKTEAILFSTPSLSTCHCLPSSIMVGTHEILFSDKVRNLGFIFHSNLTMKQHVIKICQTAYYELKLTHQLHP